VLQLKLAEVIRQGELRGALRSWAGCLAAASLLASCVDRVALGSECSTGVTFCVPTDGELPGPDVNPGVPTDPPLVDGSTIMDAGASIDAGGQVVDSSVEVDGSADDAAAPEPGPNISELIRNPSFELTRGTFGGIAYSPINPLPLGTNLIEPWGACRTGFNAVASAEAVRGSGINDVVPQNGASLIEVELTFGGRAGLRQTLATPLRAGTRYAFRIDVRASVDDDDRMLEFYSSQLDCVMGSKLTEVGPIGSEGWQSVCVSFVPPTDAPQLILVPTASGIGGRLFLDNLRADPTCR